MLRTGTILVRKGKLLTSYLIPESGFIDSAGPDLLTFRILEPFASKDIAIDPSTL